MGELVTTKIVVGLGNPGREYAATRHNLGFMVVEELARRLSATTARSRFRSELAEANLNGARVVLVKPQTYMNLSGHAVREVAHWYRVAAGDVLIVLDDLDLPFATQRLRGSGSAGGHNGLSSVIEQLGTVEVPRLRIGIGRSAAITRTQVLSRFTAEEAPALPAIVERSADCCLFWLEEGITTAMNLCNQKPPAEPTPSPEKKPSLE
ncbi:MAG: aminoacyl-tRNA hydrolase [Chloroflexia bacterium]|nr:aminoacyl-tRNA hydrolase [Chloroflexia bacterium]